MQEKKANLKERHDMHTKIKELEIENKALKDKIKEISEAIKSASSFQEEHKVDREMEAEGPDNKTYSLLQLLDPDHELNLSEERKPIRNSNKLTSRKIAESNFYEELSISINGSMPLLFIRDRQICNPSN